MPRTTSPHRLETHFPENKKNFKKFITRNYWSESVLALTRRCRIIRSTFPINFSRKPTRAPDPRKFSRTGPSENGKKLFLTGTQKIEKHFSIFFPTIDTIDRTEVDFLARTYSGSSGRCNLAGRFLRLLIWAGICMNPHSYVWQVRDLRESFFLPWILPLLADQIWLRTSSCVTCKF